MVGSSVEARIARNLSFAPDRFLFDEYQLLAARHLFTVLARLEQIAVDLAAKGGGVVGQLDDEIVHRDTFLKLAEMYGGIVVPNVEIENLVWFCGQLRGEEATALVNIVAEHWLENAFCWLAKDNQWRDLFRSIEEDETRHVELAPNPAAVNPLHLNALEKLLYDVAVSPQLMLPILHLFGSDTVVGISGSTLQRHRTACERLGVPSSPLIADLQRQAVAMRRVFRAFERDAEPVRLNQWERGRFGLQFSNPMFTEVAFQPRYQNPLREEARVIKAVAEVMAENPVFLRTGKRRQIVQWPTPTIGARRLHEQGELVTVYIESAHRKSTKDIVRTLAKRTRQVLEKPYPVFPHVGELAYLAHPTRYNAIVSNAGAYGGVHGHTALTEFEGVPISIVIGRGMLGITIDHRVFDGMPASLFVAKLKEKLDAS